MGSNTLLSQRPSRPSEVQIPTQAETLYSITDQSSQKTIEEKDTKEENTYSTNLEISTYNYTDSKSRCLNLSVREESTTARAMCNHQSWSSHYITP